MTTSEIPQGSPHGGTVVSPPAEVAEPVRARWSVRGELGWMLPIWGVVALFTVVTVVQAVRVGIPLRDPHGDILAMRLVISAGIFALYVALDGAWRARQQGRPLRATWSVVRARWTRHRLTMAAGALAAYHLTYFCYHNLKSWDVYNKPRDAMLLDWDRWLFLGHSPAVLIHDLLGEHHAAWILAYWYETFGTMVLFALVAPVVFSRRARDGWVGLTAGVWIWILGTASYYAIPSLGPFDSAPEEFSGLPHMMIQDTQARYMGQRAHLLAHPQAHDAFAQVSAFASLHVGVTTVIWLMLRYYGLKRLARLMAVFLAGTVVATVYLGWHFFVDDIAGFAIGWLACWLGRRMVYPHGRPEHLPEDVPGDTVGLVPVR